MADFINGPNSFGCLFRKTIAILSDDSEIVLEFSEYGEWCVFSAMHNRFHPLTGKSLLAFNLFMEDDDNCGLFEVTADRWMRTETWEALASFDSAMCYFKQVFDMYYGADIIYVWFLLSSWDIPYHYWEDKS